MSVTCFAQDSLSIEPRQINEADSIHVDTHTLLDNKLEDVTKTKGDSAYIKEDYADRKSTRLNSSHTRPSRMPSSA